MCAGRGEGSGHKTSFLRWLWVADATSHGPSHVYGTSGSSSCRATVDSRQLTCAVHVARTVRGSHTHIMLALVRIMPALCLMLALADYARNYARLIGAALYAWQQNIIVSLTLTVLMY